MKHTPGPWEISKHGTPAHSPQFGVYAPDSPSLRVNDHVIVVGENAEADANLIAAAPDLLAVLEGVLIASEDNGKMSDIDWNGLRAAIAKAEGNS